MAKFKGWFSKPKKEEYEGPPITSDEELEGIAGVGSTTIVNRNRDKQMSMRLTQKEYEYITCQAKKAGISKTEYIVKAVKQRPVIVLPGGSKILAELRREGVNFNQYLKLCYEYGVMGKDVEDVIVGNVEIQKKLMDLCDKWDVYITKELEE